MALTGGSSAKPSLERCKSLGCTFFDVIGKFCPRDKVPGTKACAETIKESADETAIKEVVARNIEIGKAK